MVTLFRGDPFKYPKFQFLLYQVKKYETAWFCSVSENDEKEPRQFWKILREFDYENLGKNKCVTICRKLLFGKYQSYTSLENDFAENKIKEEKGNNSNNLNSFNEENTTNNNYINKNPKKISKELFEEKETSKMEENLIKINDNKYEILSEELENKKIKNKEDNLSIIRESPFYDFLLNECKKNPTSIQSNKIKNKK